MPPEALEEARAWLTKATRDLQAAEYLAMAEAPLLDIVVYHCQQAMEKALKGYLTAMGIFSNLVSGRQKVLSKWLSRQSASFLIDFPKSSAPPRRLNPEAAGGCSISAMEAWVALVNP